MSSTSAEADTLILARLCITFLIVGVVVASFWTVVVHVGVAECQGGFNYLVEADGGGYYALVGLPSDLRSQYGNHTIRIIVTGTYYPSTSDQNFRGLIYVTQYVINGATFTYAQTVVIVSGTVTSTSTDTSQISPATVTLATAVITLTPISISGLLDYTTEYCVTTLHTTASSSTEGTHTQTSATTILTTKVPSLTPSVPGFPIESIIIGVGIGLAGLAIVNRKRCGHR